MVWSKILAANVALMSAALVVSASPAEAALTCNGRRVTVVLAAGDRPTVGNDVIFGTVGNDVIRSGRGNDLICARGGADTVVAGPGSDSVLGGDGNDTLRGGDGNDTLSGGRGRDRCIGDAGVDTTTGCERASTPPPPPNCHPSYPGVCIPPPPPDLDCGDISFRRFQVVGSDPHGFDSDADGIGCES